MKLSGFQWKFEEQLYPFERTHNGEALYAAMLADAVLGTSNPILTCDFPTALSSPEKVWKIWGILCYPTGGFCAPLPYTDTNATYNISLTADTQSVPPGKVFLSATSPGTWGSGYKAKIFVLYRK